MKNITEFQKYKNDNKPISVITCYDFWSAKIINETDIDAVLVGDSAAMVMHGFETTINANMQMMVYHIEAVKRGIKNKLIIGDMPFLSYRKSLIETMNNVELFMKAGSDAVKIEGANGHLEYIKHIVESGVPVMGHLGLTPQSVHQLGGYKVQAKDKTAADKLKTYAKQLEDAGCFSIVLELVPAKLGKEVTESLSIPTIGIGAGKYRSGQVLVLQDMLGMNKEFNPKFLRKYINGFDLLKGALNNFNEDVKNKKFPNEEESF
ncbi:MAG: 3-methyl-2-oxobutanoate hydroxymethyltransferase [Ignavibacteria bacterium GWB2_35_6b]|nr:MAG: 3-methyl-2-oxobutanoate hydroxymethyltransferase [Ignavibacteria bacterium GWB2_35_6b]